MSVRQQPFPSCWVCALLLLTGGGRGPGTLPAVSTRQSIAQQQRVAMLPGESTRAEAIALAIGVTGWQPEQVDPSASSDDTVAIGTRLCARNLGSTGAQSISFVGAATATEVATVYRGFGRDARPWNQVAADELVAQCDYRLPSHPASSVFVDASGHRTSTPTARPLP
jgi:hypothetical protein